RRPATTLRAIDLESRNRAQGSAHPASPTLDTDHVSKPRRAVWERKASWPARQAPGPSLHCGSPGTVCIFTGVGAPAFDVTPAMPRIVGRYAIFDEIASGGMATVYLGRLMGAGGFARTVAIKRLHPQFAKDPEFVAMFLDEARLAARIRHPNVVPTLDVVASKGELFLVMDYVQGESLSRIVRASMKHDAATPLSLVTTIMAGVLHGLHAAHEAKTEQGEALSIVHRDVSPQNVIVGIDGVPRVLDFGVAKASHRAHATR